MSGKAGLRRISGSRARCAQTISRGCLKASIRAPESNWSSKRLHEYKTADGKTVKTMGHRAGWDATFSAPKSVSLTALAGGDERVREAHRGRSRGGRQDGGLRPGAHGRQSAAGEHAELGSGSSSTTPQAVDGYPAPQHTHVVFFNVTETREGEFARSSQ